MNTYEKLEDEACRDGIEVFNRRFCSDRIKGLYCDGSIAINETALSTTAEKTCTMSEEMGHHYTSYGDIIDLDSFQARKQERQARLWGYNKVIGLRGIIDCYEAGCRSVEDAADFLNVTTEYFHKCVEEYTEKYGTGIAVDNYYIMFIPYFAVLKMV